MRQHNRTAGPFPPRIEEVKIYFSQKGVSEKEAETFFLFYELKAWTNRNGNYLKNWRQMAYHWIRGVLVNNPYLFNKNIH